MKRLDLVGKRFGRLVVKEFMYMKNSQSYWKCACDCGNKKIILGCSLNKGYTKSCGCLRRSDLNYIKFGRLTVISFAYVKNNKSYWLCKCDCGNEKVILGNNLKKGATSSCGCLRIELTTGKNNLGYNPNLTEEERIDRRIVPGLEKWRCSVYGRDGFTCQKCGDDKGGNLVAHHMNGWNLFPEERLTVENGITLCEDCHKDFHHQYGYGDNTRAQLIEFLNGGKLGG